MWCVCVYMGMLMNVHMCVLCACVYGACVGGGCREDVSDHRASQFANLQWLFCHSLLLPPNSTSILPTVLSSRVL